MPLSRSPVVNLQKIFLLNKESYNQTMRDKSHRNDVKKIIVMISKKFGPSDGEICKMSESEGGVIGFVSRNIVATLMQKVS